MPPASLTPVTKGLALSRYTAALAHCNNSYPDAAAFARRQWPDQPAISEVLLAAVPAGTATSSGWASELIHSGIASDFVEAVRASTVIDRLSGVRRVPFNARVPVEAAGTDGVWLGPGAAIPVSASNFAAVTLPPFKAGTISVLDDALIRLMTPQAITTIKTSMVAGVVRYLDRQFLDPNVAAVADVSPASITRGGTQVTSTGTNGAAMTQDFSNMVGAADDLISPVWVMDGKTCAKVSGTLGIPGINVINGFLFGIPILCTKSSPNPVGSPAMPNLITLIDANAVLLADEGVADVRLASVAALELKDNPTNNAATGAGANMVSLFQVCGWAAKVVRQISWARTRTAGIVWMEVAY